MTAGRSSWLRRSLANLTAALVAFGGVDAAPSSSADATFARGDFERAKAAYAADLAERPNDPGALLGVARIELYENHLDAAAATAARLLALQPDDSAAQRLVKTVDARRAILTSASALDIPAGGITLPFVESEPLPAIALRVNGRPGTFVLDTGGADVTLDPDFARDCGLTIAGGHEGTFLGGKTAEVREAVAERIDAGSIALAHVGVTILPLHAMKLFDHRSVDGVVGTAFLSRFQSTIDYPHHALIVRPRAAPAVERAIATMRMWLVGDHFIFAAGSVNGLDRQLFSIDSGGAGVGFMPDEATIAAAHIATFPDKAFAGMGGGGSATVVPTLADRVCLGDACQTGVAGGYTPGGSPLRIFPFAVSGSISHAFLERYAVTFDFARMQLVLS